MPIRYLPHTRFARANRKRGGESSLIDDLKAALDAGGYTAGIDVLWMPSRVDEENYLIDIIQGWVSTVEGTGALTQNGKYGVHSAEGDTYWALNFDLSVDGVNFQPDDACMILWLIDNKTGSQTLLGNQLNNGSSFILTPDTGENSSSVAINRQFATGFAVSKTDGFWLLERINAGSDSTIKIDDVLESSSTADGHGSPTGDFPVFARLSVTTLTKILSSHRVGAIGFSRSWSDVEATGLNTIFQDYFTAIGSPSMADVLSNDYVDYYMERDSVLYVDGLNILKKTSDSKIKFSDDGGATWNEQAFADADQCEFGYIWDNGNINYASAAKMYHSTDGVATPASEIPFFLEDGVTPFPFHTPVDANRPGQHFGVLGHGVKQYQGGNEIVVRGNYGNVYNGATPIHTYELSNDGANLRAVYRFGQNTRFRDNGSEAGSSTTGTILGDAGNLYFCKHVHSVGHNNADSDYYVPTGDADLDQYSENMWLKLTYVDSTSVYTMAIAVDPTIASSANQYKSVGVSFDASGNLWWASDGGQTGIWYCPVADLANMDDDTNLVRAYQNVPNGRIIDMIVDGTNCLAVIDNRKVIVSNDLINFNEFITDLPFQGYCFYILPKDHNDYYSFREWLDPSKFTATVKMKIN